MEHDKNALQNITNEGTPQIVEVLFKSFEQPTQVWPGQPDSHRLRVRHQRGGGNAAQTAILGWKPHREVQSGAAETRVLAISLQYSQYR